MNSMLLAVAGGARGSNGSACHADGSARNDVDRLGLYLDTGSAEAET